MVKKYIIIYTDFGDSCDYEARIMDTYDTKEKAISSMNKDIKDWCKQNDMDRENDCLVDHTDCVCMGDPCRFGCQWQILEVEV